MTPSARKFCSSLTAHPFEAFRVAMIERGSPTAHERPRRDERTLREPVTQSIREYVPSA